MKKTSRFSLSSLLGPNYRRLLFASCEFGGVDFSEPMLSQPAAERSSHQLVELTPKTDNKYSERDVEAVA